MNMQQIDDMIAEYELALKLLHEKRREIINREQKKIVEAFRECIEDIDTGKINPKWWGM